MRKLQGQLLIRDLTFCLLLFYVIKDTAEIFKLKIKVNYFFKFFLSSVTLKL